MPSLNKMEKPMRAPSSPPARFYLKYLFHDAGRAKKTKKARRNRISEALLSCSWSASAPFAFKFAHEFDEGVDALFGKCVIDRRAHSTHIPVPFEPVETCRGGLLDEQLLQFFRGEPECHIHERPATLLRRSAIKAGAVNF